LRLEGRSQAGRLAAAAVLLALFCLDAAAVVTGSAGAVDVAIRARVHRSASPALTAFLGAATHLGSVFVLAAFCLVSFVAFLVAGRGRDGARLLWIMAGAIALENGLKWLFHRARPEPFFGLIAPKSYSFPSGHMLYSACFYGALAWSLAVTTGSRSLRIALWASCGALVGVIGFSRIYLGVHYPTDVVGGLLVATAWILIVGWRQPAFGPTAGPASSGEIRDHGIQHGEARRGDAHAP